MAFSAAVKISDANDFLAPAQACVVGISGDKKASLALGTAAIVGDFAAGSVAIHGKESDFSQVRNLRWPYFRVVFIMGVCIWCIGRADRRVGLLLM